ncbi:MAG: hypothetical protein A2667_01320 [Candidatus Wildermuthbacteria bacterium RIFCSPHIGHO2_01_FULL_47_27]|uniref:Transcriptional regulator n=1 Tax=Candidatus Wildermuthbacteria bacterium RIFCSPHIGHO2_02_FULL_47_17 TaxID=1802452 RepID=A0A1G2R5K6_9BACT|nr:MAG: hypothetical protein A2667_01320 [Candidatus Wildermuthbacteria bacterium RIFCSPHIGHO2_01_FULL_47_27]OHA67381.1 MAG: hypothetical protein A3D59_01285 [Candidatus Wildermuthbacteria bacterium RIFCSPHIGHO2_02_FULL_47_17]
MDKKLKNKVMRRLKIIEGQIRGLQKMVERGDYCIDIINQSLAVKEALSGAEDLILENHLKTHATSQMKSGAAPRAVKEILSIYRLSKRR